jgi:hypothetical protein
MEIKVVELYGVAKGVQGHDINRRYFESFELNTEDGKTYNVLAKKDTIECDIEDGKKFFVRGIEVSEGVVVSIVVEQWGRYCDVCGKWHTEGYWVDETNYACSEECALTFYGGNKEQFEAELALLDNEDTADECYTYWTTWEN